MGLYNKDKLIPNDVYNLNKGIPHDVKQFKTLVNNFNKEHNISVKYKLANEIIKSLGFNIFSTCSICGGLKIFNHSKLLFRSRMRENLKDMYKISISTPSEYKREIYGKIYDLICCENCLLEHFKEYKPKTNTLMFSRGQRWSAFAYNVPEDISAKLRSETIAITKESLIRKYGLDEGLKRWKIYRSKQSYSNSFEYKNEKYGWTKEQFDNFNKSRAVTLKNLQNKYGEKEGKLKFDAYCERQRYTTSLEYMIETYGEIEGKNKFNNFCEARANSKGFTNVYSNISQKLFNIIYNELVKRNYDVSNIYYFSLNKELYYRDFKNKIGYKPDFIDLSKNLIIEFQGDYWHANPKFYDKNDILRPDNITANEIWKADNEKELFLRKKLNNVIYLKIWESDFKNNPKDTINNILSYYNIKYI